MTTSAGNPVADNQNSITAGARGPLLMQDYQLIESSRTRIVNASRSAPFTPKARARMGR